MKVAECAVVFIIQRLAHLDEAFCTQITTLDSSCANLLLALKKADPVYEVDGITHYCVANIPGSVPCTSTEAMDIPYTDPNTLM